jgi:type I restriction enzyme S subunit
MVEAPAVAIALAGQGKTRGTSALTEITLCTNQSVALIKPRDENLDALYLYYALDYRYEELRARSAGGGRAGLTKQIVQNVPIPLPNPKEQSRIAEILNALDAAIRESETLLAKLRQVKAGLLHDLLTRGLDEHGHLRDPVRHPEHFQNSALGQIPKAWADVPLSQHMTFLTSGSRGWAAYYSKEGALFLRIGNLTREHINLRIDDCVYVRPPVGSEGSRTRVQAGDLMISVTADLGITGVIPDGFGEAYVNQHLALVRLDPDRLNPRWAAHYLAAEPGRRQFAALNDVGAKAGLSLPSIAELLVARPEPEEQTKMVAILDEHDARISREQETLAKLHSLKRGLAHDLLTGRVRVKG